MCATPKLLIKIKIIGVPVDLKFMATILICGDVRSLKSCITAHSGRVVPKATGVVGIKPITCSHLSHES